MEYVALITDNGTDVAMRQNRKFLPVEKYSNLSHFRCEININIYNKLNVQI